jgi:hypothetical protein
VIASLRALAILYSSNAYGFPPGQSFEKSFRVPSRLKISSDIICTQTISSHDLLI